MLDLWTVIGAAVIALLVKYLRRKRVRLPPGPTGLPFIGNALQLDKKAPHKTITEWSDKYGDVLKIKLFGRQSVVLNSYESIYEALVKQANTFAGRQTSYRIQRLFSESDDILFTSFCPKWVYMKKLMMQTLKMYGENLENLEMITLQLIDDMLEELNEMSSEGPFDIFPVYHRCTAGIMASILHGQKLDKATVTRLLEETEKANALVGLTGFGIMLDIFPWLRHFPSKLQDELIAVGKSVKGIFDRIIKEREAEYEPGQPTCFLDGLFDQKNKEQQSDMRLTDANVYGLTLDLIQGGTFTTSLTTNALMAVLINKQDIQKQIAAEIKAEIGDRKPRLSDRKSLPYTEAAILEILRYSSILPLAIPHCTTADANINGYDIPKDTQVMVNLWKLHHSHEYWDEPWEFRPERFLDFDGTVVPPDHINRKRLLSFGASRRVCPGETLAKNRLFLLVTSLLQHYEFLPAGPNELPLHDPRDYKQSFGIEVQRYRVKLVPRED